MVILEAGPKSVLEKNTGYKFCREQSALLYELANYGLVGAELSDCLEIETKIKVDPNIISTFVNRARGKHGVRKLTDEENQDINVNTRNSWTYSANDRRRDMVSILQNIEKLKKERKSLPKNRLDLEKFRIPHDYNRESTDKIQIGQVIFYKDGKHLPTRKGLHVSEAESKATSERNRSKERIAKVSTTWSKVKPLRARGGSISEIHQVTGFEKLHIRLAINNKTRSEWQKLPPFTEEQQAELDERSRNSNIADKNNDPKNTEFNTFANNLLDLGFIPDTTENLEALKKLYAEAGRKFPYNFSERIILEAFFQARIKAESGDKDLLNKYIEIGEQNNQVWFNSSLTQEQRFITDIIHKQEHASKRHGDGLTITIPTYEIEYDLDDVNEEH